MQYPIISASGDGPSKQEQERTESNKSERIKETPDAPSEAKNSSIYTQRMNEMRVTMSQVKPYLTVFQAIAESKYYTVQDDIFENYCFFLLKNRFRGVSARAYFVQKISEYIFWERGAAMQTEQVKLMYQMGFMVEVAIVIQYLHNQILDGKSGVTHTEAIRKNLIASNIVRELLFEFIELEMPERLRAKIRATFRKILLYTDIGQMMELNYGHYDSYTKKQKAPFEANSEIGQYTDKHLKCIEPIIREVCQQAKPKGKFVQHYFRRLFLTNVSLYVATTELLCELWDCPAEIDTSLTNYATTYGTAFQIVNDVADIVPKERSKQTVGKTPEDAFSDLKNRNITLPLIYHLQKKYKRSIENYLREPGRYPDLIENNQEFLRKDFLNSHAIDNSICITRCLHEYSKGFLNKYNPITPFLINMSEIANWNTYYISIYSETK